MDERDGDTPYLNIRSMLLWKKIADVPILRRRRYVANDVQPHSGLSVRFAGSIDDEIKFPDVDAPADFDLFRAEQLTDLLHEGLRGSGDWCASVPSPGA